MAFTGTDIKTKALINLMDDGTRWADATLISFINDCLEEMVVIDPNIGVNVAVIQLAAGVVQSSGGYKLIDVMCNCTSGGLEKQSVIRLNKPTVEFTNPTWATARARNTTKFFMPSTEIPAEFFVYPPSDGTGYVKVKRASFPAAISALATAIGVGDQYKQAMVDYVCYRAYKQDTDTVNIQKSGLYYQDFLTKIQILSGQPKAQG